MSIHPTDFQLKLEEGKRYIEFGGGANPRVRAGVDVRVDVRPCTLPDGAPAVDFVVDLERPFTEEHGQAITSGEFDGAVCVYALEHVSWRKVPQLLDEMRRVLKDDGSLFLLVPDTQAQIEHLLSSKDWDDAGSMLFGGQDYGENAHKAAFTPELITRLLQAAGFTDVATHPFGAKGTDMIVTASCATAADNATNTPRKREWDGLVEGGRLCSGGPALPPLRPLSARPDPVADAAEMAEAFDAVKDRTVRQEEHWDEPSREDVPTPLNEPEDEVGFARIVRWNEKQTEHLRGQMGKIEEALMGADHHPAPWLSSPSAPQVRQESLFRRRYFEGGLPGGGGYQLYLDFPCHEHTARHALALRPESVLELGCGRGHVLKRLEDAGVRAGGWDVSRHCYLHRVTDHVVHADATDPERWHRVGEFDLCLSVAFLDHVPEDLLSAVFDGMKAKTKRGLHGVNFGPPNGDQSRATCRPREWWQERLPPGHVAVDKDELEKGHLSDDYFRGDGKVKLNLGSHMTMFHRGWVNVDTGDLNAFAGQNRYTYRQLDVRQGLPYPTGGVDLIFTCHALEHLTYSEGFEVLRECRRVLRPGGCLRVIVPDAWDLNNRYANEISPISGNRPSLSELDELSAGVEAGRTPAAKLYALLYEHHRSAYDFAALEDALKRAGFAVKRSEFRDPRAGHAGADQMRRECLDCLAEISLFVNAYPDRL